MNYKHYILHYLYEDAKSAGDLDSAILYGSRIINRQDKDTSGTMYFSFVELLKEKAKLLKDSFCYKDALDIYIELLDASNSFVIDCVQCLVKLNKYEAVDHILKEYEAELTSEDKDMTDDCRARILSLYADIEYRKGNYDCAISNMETSLALEFSNDKKFTLATYKIAAGDFEGWDEISCRFDKETKPTIKFDVGNAKEWDGSEVDGSILIVQDQGLGDVIMFSRFIENVKQKAKEVFVYADKSLVDLLEYNFKLNVISSASELSTIDFQYYVYFEDLISKLDVSDHFSKEAYLESQYYLGYPDSKINVGIAWQGSISGDKSRDMVLSDFIPLIKNEELNLSSFQKGLNVASDLSLLNIADMGTYSPNFDATARAMKGLDYFVTSDNCLAHLAGALGVKTYLILGQVPEYRWMNCDQINPWYDSVTVIRQTSDRTYEQCIEEVNNRIMKEFVAKV